MFEPIRPLYPKDAGSPLPGGKNAGGRKGDLSLTFNGDVKNAWSYTSISHVFMAWWDNYILYKVSIFHREYMQWQLAAS